MTRRHKVAAKREARHSAAALVHSFDERSGDALLQVRVMNRQGRKRRKVTFLQMNR